jgi:hypothetical protein
MCGRLAVLLPHAWIGPNPPTRHGFRAEDRGSSASPLITAGVSMLAPAKPEPSHIHIARPSRTQPRTADPFEDPRVSAADVSALAQERAAERPDGSVG